MSLTTTFDRCEFAPKHGGQNVFPNFFLFSRLVRWAHKPLTAVRDTTFGFEASYAQLMTDVLHFRNELRGSLHPTIIARIDREDEVYVLLLGPAGYEFTVAFFALMALGAIVTPISPDLPVKEATYFATQSEAVAVLTADRCLKLGADLANVMQSSTSPGFRSLPISPHLMRPCLEPKDLIVSSDRYMDLNKNAYVIFTSGTTGPPKGGVKRRGFLYDVGTQFSDQHGIREGDLVLHTLPVHHATGITVTLLPFLWSGATIEFRSGGFDTAWTWERIRKADLDFFSGVPTIYMRLMQYFEQKLSKSTEALEYAAGASRIRAMLCGTSALPRPLQQKWTKMRGGKPILTRYGGTEFGNAFTVTPWLAEQGIVPDGSVGQKGPGVDLKLSNGDEGEVLLRNPIMFSKYLNDEAATRQALDKQGYFRTGDIARKEGDYFFILGRASIDIIKSGGYKISALDIEREILGLEYISEVMVVGVEDEEFGQRVAAAVVLRNDLRATLSIDELRADLRTSLAGYKMPTVLRVVNELRKNATGKVIKKVLVKELFPTEGHQDVQRWRSVKITSKL
jgi:malonyl-CoA/methylmalonyl-CoA synthetase